MGEVVALPLREIPVDLDSSDIEAILAYVPLLPGRWRAKFARLCHQPGNAEPIWAYIFHVGPADDFLPMITISRTSTTYTVVAWDVLEFLSEGVFGEYCGDTLADALAAVRMIVVGPVGIQEGNGDPLNGRSQELIGKSL